MAKAISKYICQQCGFSQVGWAGKCSNCGEWNSMVETIVSVGSRPSSSSIKTRSSQGSGPVRQVSLSSISSNKTTRNSTKISELDRVLGGGLVSGQVVLIAGEPGIGKSTLLLQASDKLAKAKSRVLYISGEESTTQIKLRADRLGVTNDNLDLLEETNVDSIIEAVRACENLGAVVVDSIQTMATDDLSGMAGSVGQVRECAFRLVRAAKSMGMPIFIVGHVTKEGNVAGPAVLMHIVDTVLWFEGETTTTLRMLRAVKNRFGSTDEVGIFEMVELGLKPMPNPNKIFLTTGKQVAGSVVTSIMRGTRPILVETQSLVVPTKMAFPRRIAQGMDSKRFELMLAVLTKRCGLRLYDFDCYINFTGGISIKEPSSDLAVCLSVASAYLDKSLSTSTIAIGEVGLLGDIREVVQQEKRIKEAKRLGYSNIISSKQVKTLKQAIVKYLK